MVGMEAEPPTVVKDISWWLQSTKQGMWPSQLQVAKDTACLGWLLFSTDELDKEALHKEIWQMTGVQVALCYWAIDDGVPKAHVSTATKENKDKATKPAVATPEGTPPQNQYFRTVCLASSGRDYFLFDSGSLPSQH